MGKAKRVRGLKHRSRIDDLTVGDIRSYTENGEEAPDYAGQSFTILPLVVEAATPDEASAMLDVAIKAVVDALEGTDARLAVRTEDFAEPLLHSLRETTAMYELNARRVAARRARDN